ncbi:MAG TPA: MBL fold metallo-hydrolase, partial [Acidimicrobiia bacterium]|nr:MBL fold metallo-hydrolase [Acidimicrobiia bacterium]
TLAYISDHEPALATGAVDGPPGGTSGYGLARGADVLIHDAQFTDEEYPLHVGWGHSSMSHALAFAELAGVGCLVPFHYDPDHGDGALDAAWDRAALGRPFDVVPAREGLELILEH